MKYWMVAAGLACVLAGCSGSDSSVVQKPSEPPLESPSAPFEMVFHVDDLDPHFRRLAESNKGFHKDELKSVAAKIKRLASNEKASYTVQFDKPGHQATVLIKATMSPNGQLPLVRFETKDASLQAAIWATLHQS